MAQCGLCDRDLAGDRAEHHLCAGCTRATTERLARLPALHTVLAAFLAPAGRPADAGGTRPAEAPLPVDETVLTLRGPGAIIGVLEDWRAALHTDLEWEPPRITGTITDRVTAAANGLAVNLPWIAEAWPAAGDFAREIRDLEHAAMSIVDPAPRRRRLGCCLALTGAGTPCGAVVHVTEGATTARCPWCGTHWPPDTWGTLAAHHNPEGVHAA
ncbi:hypothetical protein RM844_28835 [Streptomyces sp. DSM 44915]|uniref:Uncharacterized protein n=1 Tax=Streptomyces chisholmiae TaxID=3075540 RepID=A0ABU2JZ90_9ACTN|nr:hypothetical protein [Streptomyces sp. DSM 44915]MDT0270284.1 hypothetical protein [Streptomyces sp. DSM 44915]